MGNRKLSAQIVNQGVVISPDGLLPETSRGSEGAEPAGVVTLPA